MPSRTCAGPSEERPGSVHLELPEDVAGAETDDAYLVPLHALERPVAPEGALARAAAMILAAERSRRYCEYFLSVFTVNL